MTSQPPNDPSGKTQDRTRSSLELLLNISRQLASSLDLHKVLADILFLSTRDVEAERGSLVILDEDLQPIDAAIVTAGRLHTNTVNQLESTISQGLAGWVLRNRETAFVPDTSQDRRWLMREDDQVDRTGPKSAICVPLNAHDRLVGILTIVHPQPDFFQPEDVALLRAIADMAGIAIRNAQLYESMQTARRRYHELFEDSIDPIVLTDWQGVIHEANRQMAHLLQLPKDQLRGLQIQDLKAVDRSKVGEKFVHLKEAGTISYPAVLMDGEGRKHPVQVYVRRIATGEVDLLQWILRDTSERQRLDNLREDLTAMIYHDLRSPLSNIVSSLDILDSLLPADRNETLDSVFQIAVRSTGRMQRLINSLLDISRLEAGQPLMDRKAIDVRSIVNEAVETVTPNTESKQQNLTLHLSAALPEVEADADMMRRVLINLLENAIKFTPPEGEIIFSTTAEQDAVLFRIEDSGPGIPAGVREQIFEKFTRLSGDSLPKGFGLGLAFCRLAVEAHGGKIWVEDRPQRGSRFVVQLPAAGDRTNSSKE